MSKRILIVDDEEQLCVSLSRLLKARGYDPVYTVRPEMALSLLKQKPADLVITDLKMPGLSGIDLIREIRIRFREIPILMVSGYASVNNVVQAMRYGALNFFEKPVRFTELIKDIDALFPEEDKGFRTKAPMLSLSSFNKKMQDKIIMLNKAAPTDAPVLITGESGTGKELAASIIHSQSSQHKGPFIKINCAAIPDSLLESELFGHEKGAFTDAVDSRPGKFEIAEGGTIFLDEIGEMSIKTQAKLLRVLQEKEYERVGSHTIRKMDVRIVAATNKEMHEQIKKGNFREDLFYRLSVIQIELPALKERCEDILPLFYQFLEEFCLKYNKQITGMDLETKTLFLGHHWPGNVRELRNTVERMVIFCDQNVLTADLLPEQYKRYPFEENSIPLRYVSDSISREIILEALDKTGGSRSRSAELLGISRRTLYNKMKKLSIEV
ncbi:MAG: hypothetical protein B6241_11075 [Spirochaetaceae bacterium 4572_59]|nr:MAG: hypothetical protein B6241_11075 [Spirochaetaceae bacterium 4572_59]